VPVPIHLAAIDAGSNAIRLVIARVESSSQTTFRLRMLETERDALRLGRHVFLQHRFDRQTIDKAVKVFRHFKSLMEVYDVQTYRAVATSATREARNNKDFTDRVLEASGIQVEVIDGGEEARLVRCAVEASPAGKLSPHWIADLGGGSLEISHMKSETVEANVALPLGAVRLMETFEIQDAMTGEQVHLVRNYALSLLRRFLPLERQPANPMAVLCGGNAEALALIAPGSQQNGVRTLDLLALRRKVQKIVSLDIRERMKAFHVRKDRAEVMGIAAIVIETLGRWWNLPRVLVPGVGVKEGILFDLARSGLAGGPLRETPPQAELVLSAARRYASRLGWDSKHGEKVREIAVSLFDQLRPSHRMGPEMRLSLELAALLHDIGQVVHHKLHHRHGEYLMRHAEIAGLGTELRKMAACIVRFHSEPEPDDGDKLFSSFPRKQQVQIRALVSILRIADGLDWDRRQAVKDVRVRIGDQTVRFAVHVKRSSDLVLWAARRKAGLFEAVFDRQAFFVEKR